MNYHNRKFKSISNSENGEVPSNMVFYYQQSDMILTCNYIGGDIVAGHLIGIVDTAGHIDMRYHQVNKSGEIMTGVCHSIPELMTNGKIRLHESWQWTSGDRSAGSSVLEEL